MPTQGITTSPFPQAPIKPFNPSAPSTLTLTPPAPVQVANTPAPTVAPQVTTQPSPQAPQASNGLDPVAQTLANAIALQENGGKTPNYTQASADDGSTPDGSSGKVGGGAYQFTAPTWANYAQKYLGDPKAPMTPENQNQVAYTFVKQQLDAGHSPAQVASMWNAGVGEPNAYTGTFSNGKSSAQGNYNVPAYANNVQKYAEQLYNQQGQTQTQAGPNQTPTGGFSPSGPSFLGNLASGNYLGAAQQAGDFAFPIVSDLAKDFQGSSTKSTLQQLGDAGLSAAWFLPFGALGEGATGVARAALGLGKAAETTAALTAEALPTAENIAKVAQVAKTANAAKLIGNVATGLGAGYATDVASNLSQGKTDGSVFTPGLGTLTGGAVPLALTGAGSIYNRFAGQQSIVNKIQQAYEDAAGATKAGITNMSKTAAKGLDPNPEFLAHAGILPETADINGRRVFTTGADSASQKVLEGRANDLTALRDEAISKAGQDTPMYLEDMRQRALEEADQEFAGTAAEQVQKHINDEFNAYKTQFGDGQGNISLTDANKIKMDLQGKTNYDATRPTTITRANSIMASVAKTDVENTAEKAGLPGIKQINKIIQQHIDAKKFLDKINGQTVKGGRIGKYVAEGIGATVGNTVGAHFGGTVGQVAGTLVGTGVGSLFSRFLQKFAAGGTISAAAIGRMAHEDPEVIQQFLQYLGKHGESVAPMLNPIAETGSSIAQDAAHYSPGDLIHGALPDAASNDAQRSSTHDTNQTESTISTNASNIPHTLPQSAEEASTLSTPVSESSSNSNTLLDKTKAVIADIKKNGNRGFVKNPFNDNMANGDAAAGDAKLSKTGGAPSPTSASKPSTDINTPTGNAPIGKEGVSAQKADTSAPFGGKPYSAADKTLTTGKYGTSKLNPTEIGSWSPQDIASGKSPLQGNTSIDSLRLSNQSAGFFKDFADSNKALGGLEGTPEKGYTVYRVVPKGGSISEGDFVFTNRKSAEQFIEKQGKARGQTEIVSTNAKENELLLPYSENQLSKQVPRMRPYDTPRYDEFIYAPKSSPSIPKELAPLAAEARKYKSAEEFVKAQQPVYHGSPVPLKSFSNKKGGVFFTDNYEDATGFAGTPDNTYEGYLNFKNPLVIDAKGAKWDELNTKFGKSTQEVVSNAHKAGYDGVTFKNIVDNAFDTAGYGESTIHYAFKPKDAFLNESQLTDFYKKATGR